MKTESEIDEAFRALIGQSAQLLAQGKAKTPFTALKRQPKRLEIDFGRIVQVHTAEPELDKQIRREYRLLYQELLRFEPKAVLISSPEPGQGVSFTAHNLARMWSREAGKKILLLELYNGESGLPYDCPEGSPAAHSAQELENYIGYCPENGLYLLSAHATKAEGMHREAWLRLSSSFDMIVIDCSPFWHNARAIEFAPLTAGLALVCGQKPNKVLIDRLERDLNNCGAHFIGVIMNAVDQGSNDTAQAV